MHGLTCFSTTNNEAEYEALITGLDLGKGAGAMDVVVYVTLK